MHLPAHAHMACARWQSVYNEELFFLSHDDYVSPGLSVRVMNIHKFMNSKARRARTFPYSVAERIGSCCCGHSFACLLRGRVPH